MAPVIANLSAKQTAALKKAGKWFPFGGKAYASAAARSAAQKASGSSGPSSGSRSRPVAKVNTSALFWSSSPGPRENVDHVSRIVQPVAWFTDKKCVLPFSGASTLRQFSAFAPALPSKFELVSLKIKVECGLLKRDVRVQMLVVVATSVADAAALDWDVVRELKTVKWYGDLQSVNSEYKVNVGRPVNSSSDAPGALVVLFRAVDAETPNAAQIKILVTATTSQLKTGLQTLDL